MGKTFLCMCCVLGLSMCFIVRSASALPTTPYYTAQSATFSDVLEEASYESDFFLYAMSDPTKTFKVFGYKQEALSSKKVTVNDWGYLDDGFGFMFAVHTGGASDPTADYKFYSDPLLNQYANGTTADKGFQHIKIATTLGGSLRLGLDDQLRGPYSDADYDDMVIKMNSCNLEPVAAAPVPEPTTVLLFGTGIMGLAAVGRRKKVATV